MAINLLRQPYPQDETAGHGWRIALSFGLFVGTFLWLFQPFDINTWQTDHKILKIWGFGGITFGIMVVFMVLVPRLIPRLFAEEHWTVGKQIAYILTQIVFIAASNRFYMTWLTGGSVYQGWLSILLITSLVGVFPTTAAVVANYIRQLKRYQQQAATLSASLLPHSIASVPPPPAAQPASQPATEPLLTLVAENEKDALTLAPGDLLAIESSDNYCTIFYARKDNLAKELMRTSLSRLASQLLHDQPVGLSNAPGEAATLTRSFVRCHRSYVVNMDRVERVSGNAQGYKLHLLNGQLTIPVARKYNDTLIARMGQQV